MLLDATGGGGGRLESSGKDLRGLTFRGICSGSRQDDSSKFKLIGPIEVSNVRYAEFC